MLPLFFNSFQNKRTPAQAKWNRDTGVGLYCFSPQGLPESRKMTVTCSRIENMLIFKRVVRILCRGWDQFVYAGYRNNRSSISYDETRQCNVIGHTTVFTKWVSLPITSSVTFYLSVCEVAYRMVHYLCWGSVRMYVFFNCVLIKRKDS